jgi:arylsulfatase A-like enzyme
LFKSNRERYHTDVGRQVIAWTKEDHRRLTYVWDLGDGITKTKRPGGLPWEAPEVEDNALRDGHLAEAAVAKLRELKSTAAPFFLAVGFHKPHLPCIAPKKYFDLYDPAKIEPARNPYPPEGAPKFATYNWNDLRHYYGIPDVGPVSAAQARELKHAYLACVSFMDAQVGKLLLELDRLGLRDNTIVVLWGDHGWQLGEHGMWDKHSNYETLIRNPNAPWKNAALSQYRRVIPGYGQVARGMGYAMRTDRFRVVQWVVPGTDFQAYELYDHKTDPGENVNLANHTEYKLQVEKLKAKLKAGWRAAIP